MRGCSCRCSSCAVLLCFALLLPLCCPAAAAAAVLSCCLLSQAALGIATHRLLCCSHHAPATLATWWHQYLCPTGFNCLPPLNHGSMVLWYYKHTFCRAQQPQVVHSNVPPAGGLGVQALQGHHAVGPLQRRVQHTDGGPACLLGHRAGGDMQV